MKSCAYAMHVMSSTIRGVFFFLFQLLFLFFSVLYFYLVTCKGTLCSGVMDNVGFLERRKTPP